MLILMCNLITHRKVHFGDFLPDVLQVKKKGYVMIFELQAFCAGDLTGRQQLTVKVDHDQNKTFVYSTEVQKHRVVVTFIFINFLLNFLLHITHPMHFLIFRICFSNLVNM